MQVQSSGRLFAGGGIQVELVLFETLAGNFLDHGVPSALISHLCSQCGPTQVTHARTTSPYSDYVPGLTELADISAKLDTEKDLFVQLKLDGNAADGGAHLVVLDGLNSILEQFQIQSISKLLHRARRNSGNGQHRTIFSALVHSEDFDKSTCDALRSLATSNVQVIQDAVSTPNGAVASAASFTVSDDITLHVRRRKASGRVNYDMVRAKFDATKNTLTDVIVQDTTKKDAKSNEGGNDTAAFASELNLPFKVTLSKKERMARAAVQLPFVHRDAEIADGGLALHPRALHVSGEGSDGAETSSSSSDEGLFSEDV